MILSVFRGLLLCVVFVFMCVINVVLTMLVLDRGSNASYHYIDCKRYQLFSMGFTLNTRVQRPEIYHFKISANKQHVIKYMFIVQRGS